MRHIRRYLPLSDAKQTIANALVTSRLDYCNSRFHHIRDITKLYLDLNNCDAGGRIGDALYNSMAYAHDITLFSTNVQDLQNLIDVCVAYSKRWRFKFGVEKWKCMIVGKCSLYQDPKWRLGDKCLCNEESLNILGNVFNRGGNNASHVTNRLTKCRQ